VVSLCLSRFSLLGVRSVQAVCKKLSTEAKKLGDENLDLRSVSRPSDVSSKFFFRDSLTIRFSRP
jgi:hypothetical protein